MLLRCRSGNEGFHGCIWFSRTDGSDGESNSVSDAGVGALAARAAVLGAWLNVRINAAASIKDRNRVEDLLKEAAGMAELALQKEDAILEIVNSKI